MEYVLQPFARTLEVTRIANVQYFEFTNLYHTRRDSHDFCELLYVDKGAIEVQAEHFCGTLNENQMLIHRAGEAHALSCGEAVAPNVIIIGFETASRALDPFSEKPVNLTPDNRRMLARILSESMSVFEPPYDIPNLSFMKKREKAPFGADQMIKLCLESFLITLVREHASPAAPPACPLAPGSGNIQGVYDYLVKNYTAKITLDQLCFLFGTNKTTLCAEFRQSYGNTIQRFLQKKRIAEAKSALRRGDRSVTEIADTLGFDSVHYFCRVFKKSTGQSPTAYMKTVRAKLDL